MAHSTGAKIADGTFEPETAAIIRDILESGDTFIDVGANVGYFSMMASELVSETGKVVAFEPDAENFAALCHNTRHMQQVFPVHKLLSENTNIQTLFLSTHSSCHSLVETDNFLSGQQSAKLSISFQDFYNQYLAPEPIKLVKIDVEGAEIMVLNGMKNLLSEKKINALVLEFCPSFLLSAGHTPAQLASLLLDHYTVSILEDEFAGHGLTYLTSPQDFEKAALLLQEQGSHIRCNLFCEQIDR
ncbi:MAG: FkbM family methyltransferase [Balneolaceae bacterium]